MCESDLSDDATVEEREPLHRDVDGVGVEEGHRHVAVGLVDAHPLELVGAAPDGQVHVLHVTVVAVQLREPLVDDVLDQVGRG